MGAVIAPIKIHTIGYGNRSWDDFAETLTDNNIKMLIDVRREGSRSHTPGLYAQGYRHFADRLLRIRPHKKAVHYVAAPELSNTFKPPDELEKYKKWLHGSEGASLIKRWVYIFDSYMHLGLEPCLMCCELKAIKDGEINCHRVMIAEYLRERLQYWMGREYQIVHL